jgi:thymidylate kinase
MRKGLYILFEGNTGTGKTTHAKKLTEYLNELKLKTYYRKSIPSFTKIGRLIRILKKYSKSNFFVDFLYVLDAFFDHTWIKIMRNKGYNIIQDRSTPSLKAFIKSHRIGLNQKVIINMIDCMERYFTEPNLVFYFTSEYDEKIKRMYSKNDLTSSDYSLILNKKNLDNLESELERNLKKYKSVEKIDTTKKEIEEVDKVVLKKVLSMFDYNF